jgi:hypothetical protein
MSRAALRDFAVASGSPSAPSFERAAGGAAARLPVRPRASAIASDASDGGTAPDGGGAAAARGPDASREGDGSADCASLSTFSDDGPDAGPDGAGAPAASARSWAGAAFFVSGFTSDLSAGGAAGFVAAVVPRASNASLIGAGGAGATGAGGVTTGGAAAFPRAISCSAGACFA